jgi:alkaline phosphatase
MTAEIFKQVFTPRFGDGPDILISAGRGNITKALQAEGIVLEDFAKEKGRPILSSVAEIAPTATRALVLLPAGDFDKAEAVDAAVRILSRNKKGYFLMVEADAHTDPIRRGLERLAALDRIIEKTARTVKSDTLLLFTADHSFDIRIRGGVQGKPILEGLEAAEKETPKGPIRIPAVRMENGHTGEPVMVAAQGPGATRVRGYMANTDIFRVMMDAFGWPVPKTPPPSTRGTGRP